MGAEHTVSAYIKECLAQVPASWKRGQAVVSLIFSIGVPLAAVIGFVLGVIPGWVPLVITAAIAFLDIFVVYPFKAWKANKIRIDELESKLKRKGNDLELYKKLSSLWDRGNALNERNDDDVGPAIDAWNIEVQQCLRDANELDELEGFRTLVYFTDKLTKMRHISMRVAAGAKVGT